MSKQPQPQQIQDVRPLLNLINSYKENITNLEIKNANYAVALDDLREENAALREQLETIQKSLASEKTSEPLTIDAEPAKDAKPEDSKEPEEVELPLDVPAVKDAPPAEEKMNVDRKG